MTKLIDVNASFVEDIGEHAIKRVQDIPEDFLSDLRDHRDASNARAGEFHRVCSVPVAVHESWLRQGYDMTKEPAKNTVARLRREGLDAFITTTKRL